MHFGIERITRNQKQNGAFLFNKKMDLSDNGKGQLRRCWHFMLAVFTAKFGERERMYSC